MSEWRYSKRIHSIFEGKKELCGFGISHDAIAEWVVAEHNKISMELLNERVAKINAENECCVLRGRKVVNR